MTAEAAFSVTAKTPEQALVTLRGDTWDEFLTNANAAGVDGASYYARAFGGTPAAPAVTEQQAVQNVVQTFPGAAPVAPLPQPGAAAPAPAAASLGGNCAHGVRVYKESVTRKGTPQEALWKRWECSTPWSKDATGRCQPVNVR